MRFPLTFLLLTSLCLPLVAQQATRLGDFDNDGIATVRDIALIAGHFSGTATLTDVQKQTADVNRDGAVNATDMGEIAKVIRRNPEIPAAWATFTAPRARDRNMTHSSRPLHHKGAQASRPHLLFSMPPHNYPPAYLICTILPRLIHPAFPSRRTPNC